MLTPGTRIGPYEILSPLGAGGMGEVYRARDAALQRDVAIKVLPDDFAQDAERLARFEREARTLAALNHPHIAHVYGLENTGGVRALVLELVEGPTLGDRLAQGPLALDEALPVARQIAEALEAAHAQGIIHRDLKPANIKVRADGAVKVLDFGLAKAIAASSGARSEPLQNSPTITSPLMTHQGVILGTAAYMAPEQAKGRPVDARADVWAFGCVLYEMLTARRAFPGEDVTETLAAVVRADTDWSVLPPETPPSIRRLLRRCLVKDPKSRLTDIGVARLEIDDAGEAADSVAATARTVAHPRARWVAIAGSFILGALITGLTIWTLAPVSQPLPTVRLAIPFGDQVAWTSGPGTSLTVSPDGAYVAYLGLVTGVSRPQVFLRALNSDTSSLVAGSVAASGLFFSPDGKQIGFTRESKIWRAPVSGGAPFEVGPVASGGGAGTAWAEDGYIYSSGRLGLSRVLASGGTRESLTTVDAASGELAHRFPSPVPGRDAIVFTVFKGSLDEARVGILDLRTREWRVLLDRPGHYPRVTRSGRLFFVHRGALLAVRFDTRTLTVTGEPEALLNGVLFATGAEAAYDVSQTGALVYVSESDTGVLTTPTWIARERRATVPEDPLPPEGSYSELAVSPDGLQLALVEGGASPGTRRAVGGAGIAIWDLVRGAFRARLASDGLRASPVWDAGSRNVFFMNRSGGIGSAGAIYRQRADGSDSATPIFADPIAQPSGSSGRAPASLSSDGSKLFYHFTGPPSPGSQNQTIEVFDLTQSRSQKLIAPGTDPQISPDGRWLAYSAPGANGFEVYVRPYPDVDRERWTVSVGGGHWPRWSRDGRELFYESGGRILSVAIDTSKDFSASQPQPVFESVQPLIYYAVHPDGRRLLALPVTKSARPVARVILNCCQSSRN